MTKAQLVAVSVAWDALDLVGIGQVPPLSWMLSAPVQAMHFAYAGKRATTCLLEMIPLVGILPIFTIAALTYPDLDAEQQRRGPDPVRASPDTAADGLGARSLPVMAVRAAAQERHGQ